MSSQIADVDEVMKRATEQEKELQKIVTVSDGEIVINVAYPYKVALDRCDSHEKILGWVLHLSPKTWMTKDVLERFVRVAVRENGLDVQNP